MEVIGKSIIRKEAQDKVTGSAKYTNDYQMGTCSQEKWLSAHMHMPGLLRSTQLRRRKCLGLGRSSLENIAANR